MHEEIENQALPLHDEAMVCQACHAPNQRENEKLWCFPLLHESDHLFIMNSPDKFSNVHA